jgi:large subunit ribosomal protein L16
MGKGKGNVDHWISKIKAGSLICELEVRSSVTAIKALQLAQLRIPFKTKITYQI